MQIDWLEKYKRTRVLRHSLFFLSYVLGYSLLYTLDSRDFILEFISHIFYVPHVMLGTYFTVYFLLPKYLYKNKFKSFFLYSIISAIVVSFLLRAGNYFVLVPWMYSDMDGKYALFGYGIIARIPGIYFTVLLAAGIKLFVTLFEEKIAREQLSEEKLEAELNFLKAQIHPHFLFNTLNNIYVLAKKKTDEAPEMILKLSELLRYIIYECNNDKIPVGNEIKALEEYIELEKIRHGTSLEVKYSNILPECDILIPPLIFIPLVENAFKHGINNLYSNKWINIEISSVNNEIIFVVENPVPGDKSESKLNEAKGIGLRNVERRLDILYQKNFSLTIKENNDIFSAVLKIRVNEGKRNI